MYVALKYSHSGFLSSVKRVNVEYSKAPDPLDTMDRALFTQYMSVDHNVVPCLIPRHHSAAVYAQLQLPIQQVWPSCICTHHGRITTCLAASPNAQRPGYPLETPNRACRVLDKPTPAFLSLCGSRTTCQFAVHPPVRECTTYGSRYVVDGPRRG